VGEHRAEHRLVETERRFLPDGGSAGAARVFAVTAVADEPGVSDCVALLVSELASNAILHARTAFSVRIDARHDRVRVEVGDADPTLPYRKFYASDAVTGRGLAIVEGFADRWGAEPTGTGKIVWFEIDLPMSDGR
jgi:anti-sigma regulatory factor (Ser/Thr protein kinase)